MSAYVTRLRRVWTTQVDSALPFDVQKGSALLAESPNFRGYAPLPGHSPVFSREHGRPQAFRTTDGTAETWLHRSFQVVSCNLRLTSHAD